jgi:signal transduction histidine kinase
LFYDSNGTVWAGTGSNKTALVRFDYEEISQEKKPSKTIIEKVLISGEDVGWYILAKESNDSTILAQQEIITYGKLLTSIERDSIKQHFLGVKLNGISSFYSLPQNLILPYKHNALSFEFNAIELGRNFMVNYQYMLEGMENEWNPISKKTDATYNNLREGEYTFMLKSQSPQGIWSKPVLFNFSVLPPWYRTWWAYIIYLVSLAVLVILIVKENTKRLLQQKIQLELTVETRTQELKDANDKLLELDEFKEGMTGMIVHDLKNPLNGIINISKSYSLEKQLFRTKQIGKQILNMVVNILDVYKYEETKLIVDKLDHSLYKISQNAINEVAFLADQKNIEISNAILPETGVKADKEIAERIFVNILTNAIKYTPNNGSIGLSTKEYNRDKSYVYIEIVDTGIGIPSDQLDKVFDKFSQVSAKKSGKIRSTGLGLTFCKIAVEAHEGEIAVVSNTGQGTTFWFTLPVGKFSEKTSKLQNIRKFVKEDRHIITSLLTVSEKQLLEPFLLEFRKFKIYEISKLRKLLNQIEAVHSKKIELWKEEMSLAIRSGNEEKYRQLVNETLKR